MFNQRAFAPIFLVLLAAAGALSFLVISNTVDFSQKSIFSRLSPKPQSQATVNPSNWSKPTVFAHYYPWYGGPPDYQHWSSRGRIPPSDIDPKYYPALGAYNGGSTATLDQHMKWLKDAKVDVIILSYWGINHEWNPDAYVKRLLDKAAEHGIKVAFNLEPAAVEDQRDRIIHILTTLTNNAAHTALYKAVRPTKYGTNPNPRPLFIFFDWGKHYGDVEGLTTDQTKAIFRDFFDSLRNTPYDGIFLLTNSNNSLVLDPAHPNPDHSAMFGIDSLHSDGNYGYNADTLWTGKTFAKSNNYINLIHVAPGFDNTRIGKSEVVERRNGLHYDDSWREVVAQKPEWVVILTFNEWGENSQIEPAKPFSFEEYKYQDYEGHFGLTSADAQSGYITRTAFWVNQYKDSPPNPTPTPGGGGNTPTPTPRPTPTLRPTPTPTPNSGSTVTIYAAGTPFNGEYPKMTFSIDNQLKATFTVNKGKPFNRSLQTFTYTSDKSVTAKQIQIGFINDFADRDLLVDKITINGINYEIESETTYSTGTVINGNCQPGYPKSEWLHCNGYFALEANDGIIPTPSPTPTPRPIPTLRPTPTPTPKVSSDITIYAAGTSFNGEYPMMGLYIDYQLKATFIVDKALPLSGVFQTFTYKSDAPVTTKQIQIGFINDYNDPNGGGGRDLLVDKITINGINYEIESETTYSTGTVINGNCQPGYPKSEWLHCNGYFALEAN